mgnify:CR=1 FL=1
MRATLAIVRRDLGSLLQSAMAAAVLTGFLVAMGLFFAIFLVQAPSGVHLSIGPAFSSA